MGGNSQFNAQSSQLAAQWSQVATVIELLSQVRSIDDVVGILRVSVRRILGADGIAVVLRDNGQCHYVAEDAKEPLWRGQRFPAETCVSGWAMQHVETVVIPDIFRDPRVPQQAYKSTFVRSLVMVPIGRGEPVAALGCYWGETRTPTDDEIALMETIARGAATGLENGRLLSSLEELNRDLETRVAERTAELERTQESLRQTQKMEIIGQLTGNVAHDFNNLLSPIMSSLDLVLARQNADERVSRSASIAMEAAETAKTLVQRLLAFARRQPLLPAAVDVAHLFDSMQSLLISTVGSRIVLEFDVENDLPSIRADRHQLEMGILNLAVNARDAMPEGGTLTIRAERAQGPLPQGLRSGEFIVLTVRDNGIGMDTHTLSSATEPFFTTKAVGQGTGLGLSMVDGLTSQLGGKLVIASKSGEGTDVQMWLPVARRAALVSSNDTAPASTTQTSHGRLMLIDDDAMVRLTTAEMLRDLGFEVKEVDNARDGLQMIENGYKPDIVVTDHVMPGMTGSELALRLRLDHPEIAILIVSGYQGIDLVAPDIVRLSKPYRQAQLAASIAAARSQRRTAII